MNEANKTSVKEDPSKYISAVEAAREHTAKYATDPEFLRYWLGLTDTSGNFRAQQIRVFAELVGSITHSLEGWRILDVGCGDGGWLRTFLRYDAIPEDVVGVDVSDVKFTSGRIRNPKIRLVAYNGHTLPFEDDEFDLVTQFVCFSSIPTVALRRRVAAEIQRILNPGGYVFW